MKCILKTACKTLFIFECCCQNILRCRSGQGQCHKTVFKDLFFFPRPCCLYFSPLSHWVCKDNHYQSMRGCKSFFSFFFPRQALEACKDAGLVKSLGVSNFNRRQLELLLNKPGLKHKPVSNQVSLTYLSSLRIIGYWQEGFFIYIYKSFLPSGCCKSSSFL